MISADLECHPARNPAGAFCDPCTARRRLHQQGRAAGHGLATAFRNGIVAILGSVRPSGGTTRIAFNGLFIEDKLWPFCQVTIAAEARRRCGHVRRPI